MANISAHVVYFCASCINSSAEDYFDLDDEDDFPESIDCPNCDGTALEDGSEVFVDGEQVDGYGKCECGSWTDRDAHCISCSEDEETCPECGGLNDSDGYRTCDECAMEGAH